ncbi:hypothetical protein ABK040_014750 [Willaertia magna]
MSNFNDLNFFEEEESHRNRENYEISKPSSNRKNAYLNYEDYEWDEEDEKLLREQEAGYEMTHQDHEEDIEGIEEVERLTEEELTSKVKELNIIALKIDIGIRSQELSETQFRQYIDEMNNTVKLVCQNVNSNRDLIPYNFSKESTYSSTIIPLVRGLKEDIRNYFHSQDSSANTSLNQKSMPNNNINNNVKENWNQRTYEVEEDNLSEEQTDNNEYEEDDEENQYELRHEQYEDQDSYSREDERQETNYSEEEKYEESSSNFSLTPILENLKAKVDNLRKNCAEKSMSLIKSRSKREAVLLEYQLAENLSKYDDHTSSNEACRSLLQKLLQNYEMEMKMLEEECQRYEKESSDISLNLSKILNSSRFPEEQEISTPNPRTKPRETFIQEEIQTKPNVNAIPSSFVTPKNQKFSSVFGNQNDHTTEPALLTPSQIRERQENYLIQDMYNKLEASLSKTPKSEDNKRKEEVDFKAANQMKKKPNENDSHKTNLNSKEEKKKTVSPETARRLAVERLKKQKQKEKEQKEREEAERQERIRRMEEFNQRTQEYNYSQQKAATSKKYVEELLNSMDLDFEEYEQMTEEEKKNHNEKIIAEATRKAQLRAKEMKVREAQRQRELEEERKRKEAEKWRKRDEALAAFKLKQDLEKKEEHQENKKKPTNKKKKDEEIINLPRQTKKERPVINQNTNFKPIMHSPNRAIPTSPLLDLDGEEDQIDEFLQFSPAPPMFSEQR